MPKKSKQNNISEYIWTREENQCGSYVCIYRNVYFDRYIEQCSHFGIWLVAGAYVARAVCAYVLFAILLRLSALHRFILTEKSAPNFVAYTHWTLNYIFETRRVKKNSERTMNWLSLFWRYIPKRKLHASKQFDVDENNTNPWYNFTNNHIHMVNMETNALLSLSIKWKRFSSIQHNCWNVILFVFFLFLWMFALDYRNELFRWYDV